MNVEAAVWPRHADDFAFSQAGDEEDEQSLSLQGLAKGGEEEEGMGSVEEVALAQGPRGVEVMEVEEVGGGLGNADSLVEEEGEVCEPRVEQLDSFNLKVGRGFRHMHVDDSPTLDMTSADTCRIYSCLIALAFDELQVIYEKNRTGFEDSKDFQPSMDSLVAGRYHVRNFLGSAVFSTAIECRDITVEGDESKQVPRCLWQTLRGVQACSLCRDATAYKWSTDANQPLCGSTAVQVRLPQDHQEQQGGQPIAVYVLAASELSLFQPRLVELYRCDAHALALSCASSHSGLFRPEPGRNQAAAAAQGERRPGPVPLPAHV